MLILVANLEHISMIVSMSRTRALNIFWALKAPEIHKGYFSKEIRLEIVDKCELLGSKPIDFPMETNRDGHGANLRRVESYPHLYPFSKSYLYPYSYPSSFGWLYPYVYSSDFFDLQILFRYI